MATEDAVKRALFLLWQRIDFDAYEFFARLEDRATR